MSGQAKGKVRGHTKHKGRAKRRLRLNAVSNDLVGELTREALRKDGPLIDVTLHAKCTGDVPCEPVRGKALIDTGADRTAVELSKFRDVEPSGVYHAQGVTSESVPLPVFPLLMKFDDGLGEIHLDRVAATPHLKSQGLLALIGRDVLEKSQLHYDGPSGTYTLSTPSGTTRIEGSSKAPLVAAGVALALGGVAAWLLLPSC